VIWYRLGSKFGVNLVQFRNRLVRLHVQGGKLAGRVGLIERGSASRLGKALKFFQDVWLAGRRVGGWFQVGILEFGFFVLKLGEFPFLLLPLVFFPFKVLLPMFDFLVLLAHVFFELDHVASLSGRQDRHGQQRALAHW